MCLPGIKPDLMKVSAVVEISNPTDNAGIRCILASQKLTFQNLMFPPSQYPCEACLNQTHFLLWVQSKQIPSQK